ncbi:MAG: hypothetical protein Q7R43_01005 [Candidatus Daviesbacteria bacterium]|nr:hypothetical protein [Candidatus Daviesbacteria bacterium]
MIQKIFPHLLIILISIILTIIFTWPFATKLSSFFYDRGDYPVSLSILSYNQEAFKSGKIFNSKTYFQGNEFYPQPDTLIYFDFRLVPSLIYSPIFWLSNNPIFSINLTLFLAFVFSFIFSFYTINYFIKNKLASIIGATIYTFNPISFSRFPEHFDLFHKYFLPLVFLFGFKFLKTPNLKDAFLFFLIFTLNAFSSISYQIFTLTLLPFFALPPLFSNLKNKCYKYFWDLFKFSLIFLIFVPIFIYFDGAYLKVSENEGLNRPIELNSFFSARLIDYFSSTKQSFLYGSFVSSLDEFRSPKDKNGNFNYLEHTLFLNIIPMFLFSVAIICLIKKKTQFFLPFFILLILSFLLTLGPFFQGWNGSTGTFKLPFYYLYQILPFLKGNRTPARFEFIFYIPFSLIASFGFIHLIQKRNKYFAYLLFIIILAGLLLENYNISESVVSFNEKSSIIPQLYMMDYKHELAFLKGKRTLHLPVKTLDWFGGLDSLYLNWASVTGEKIVNGNVASYIPNEQINFLSNFTDKIDEKELKKLIAINVDYIIIHQSLEKFKSLENLYKQAIVYNSNNIVILDLKEIKIPISECNFEKDISLDVKSGFIIKYMRPLRLLYLRNKSDCYMTSIYNEKYRNIIIKSMDLFGNLKQYTLYFKLPPVIEPFEEIILSEEVGNLRVEQK